MTKDVENTTPSFLSRWARRKADAQADDKVGEVESLVPENVNPITGVPFEAKMVEESQPERNFPLDDSEHTTATPAANEPLPDIDSLTNESDFTPFMGRDVSSDMRNQAMKKLFTDPHYNVMDGLDIYIDDYTKSDPIPLEMLRKMTQSKALFLFEEEEKAEAEAEAAAALAVSERTGAGENMPEETMPPKVVPPQTDDGPASKQVMLENSPPMPMGVITASIKSA